MNDILQAVANFFSSGYTINVDLVSKDELPFEISVEDDGAITLSKENRVICSITVTKTEGAGQVIFRSNDGTIITRTEEEGARRIIFRSNDGTTTRTEEEGAGQVIFRWCTK